MLRITHVILRVILNARVLHTGNGMDGFIIVCSTGHVLIRVTYFLESREKYMRGTRFVIPPTRCRKRRWEYTYIYIKNIIQIDFKKRNSREECKPFPAIG